ncbi:MAG: DeoR/GlpR family DNA-binding transcription regulator [Acutalibacteraceae bacterium]
MLTTDRRAQILEILRHNGSVTVSKLAEKFETSESTIRRDLLALSQLGKINKVHGGATVLGQEFLHNEEDFNEKSLMNINEKEEIAKYAASQIKDDDFVFIDAGTTTFLMTKYISSSKATFVTNGIAHAKELTAKGCKVFVIGGELKSTTEAIIGLVAASNLQKYNFSKAFIGTNGVSEKQGFTTPDTEEAMLKAVAMERSFVTYALRPHKSSEKFQRYHFHRLSWRV